MTVMHSAGGGRTSHTFTSISVSNGSFRWRLAGGSLAARWRVTDVCESTQHECENFPNWWLKTIIVLRIAACEGEHPDGSSAASKGSKGHPSAPVQLRLRPSTFAVATDTTTGEPFNFFLPKSKSSSSRSSVLSACGSIFTKQNVPVVTLDGPAHYNVHNYYAHTLVCQSNFSNSYLAKTPSPIFVWNTDLKKFRKWRTTPYPIQ